MPHSMIHGNACFVYFNKIWDIPFPTTAGPLVFNFNTTATFSAHVVPLPAALPLFATGLGALGLLGWRRKKAA